MKTLYVGKQAFKVPEGYKRVFWHEMEIGRIVWIVGTALGSPHAYGPHIVENVERRLLRSPKLDKTFQEPNETLLTKEG